MAAIPTAVNEIDRKLHRIVLDTDPRTLTTMMALARSVEQEQYDEFSYTRDEKTEYSGANTIHTYVSYARTIGLLNGDLEPNQPKPDVRSLDNFQQWLSNTVVQFLSENNSSIPQIQDAMLAALGKIPRILPTLENIHARLTAPPPPPVFRLSLKIVTLLRPNALQVRSRRVVLIAGILEE